MHSRSEARKRRNWDFTESGSCASVSTSVSAGAARRPGRWRRTPLTPEGGGGGMAGSAD